MESILLKNISQEDVLSDILIDGENIVKIRPAGGSGLSADEVVDCSRKAVMPSFFNMHTHAAMSLMRGMREDTTLGDWLSRESGMSRKR